MVETLEEAAERQNGPAPLWMDHTQGMPVRRRDTSPQIQQLRKTGDVIAVRVSESNDVGLMNLPFQQRCRAVSRIEEYPMRFVQDKGGDQRSRKDDEARRIHC